MSKKKTEATETGLDELNDSLTNVTRRMQENKRFSPSSPLWCWL